MRRYRVLLSLALAALIAVGWLKSTSSTASAVADYSEHIRQGDSYREERLYQKAILEYEEALAGKEDPEVRRTLIETCEISYQEGFTTSSEYAKALEAACSADEKNADYWKKLIGLYVETSARSKAYDAYRNAVKKTGNEEAFREFKAGVLYDYSLSGVLYESVSRSPEGDVTLCHNGMWGVIGSDGQWIYDTEYDYASPMGAGGLVVLSRDGQCLLQDTDGVIQGFLPEETGQVLACGDGIVPMLTDKGECRYMNVESGDLSAGTYAAGTSFENGTAWVRTDAGWEEIGTDYESASDLRYDEVKVYSGGRYRYDSMMLASKDGVFGLYDEKGKEKMTLSCSDMDGYFGDYLAFQNGDGLWGYVNSDGEVVIEPAYPKARSFSRGLAAVSDGEKWGYIDRQGDLVIEYQFSDADYFTPGGFALVSNDGTTYQILQLRN